MSINKSINEYSKQLEAILPNNIKFGVTWKRISINHSDKYNLEKEFQNEIKGKYGVYVYSLNEIPLYIGEGDLFSRAFHHLHEAQLSRIDNPRKINYFELFGEEDNLRKEIIDSRNYVKVIGRSINQVRFFSHEKIFTSLDIHYLVIPTNDRKNVSKCFESFLTLHLKPVYERIKSKTGGLWVSHNLYNNALYNSYNEALLEFKSKI